MLEGVLVDLVPFGERFKVMEHRWYNSDGVYFWGVGDRWFRSKATVERHQKRREENRAENENRVTFGVQTKDGTPIGLFGINWLHLTYRLGLLTAFIAEPDYWSSGYGTDALLLVLEYAFDWLDLRKAWVLTMSANPRVMRQMEKVGFKLEMRQRDLIWIGDQWADGLGYGILREEWPGRAALIESLNWHTPKEK
jgi:RimJ/RimL family protein N-acetyltransferase